MRMKNVSLKLLLAKNEEHVKLTNIFWVVMC